MKSASTLQLTGNPQFARTVLAAVVLAMLGMMGLQGQGNIQEQEQELLFRTLQKQVAELQEELAKARQGENKPVEEALVAANKEAEDYRVRYRDLLLRVEALGLETIRSDEAIQDRLAKGVRERQIYKERYERALEQLDNLHQAVGAFLPSATSKDPALRAALEAEMRNAENELAQSETKNLAKKVDINDGHVISYKEELGLAVLDIGSQSGVLMGMPVNIFRKDRLVGTALVVEVRDTISGAIVQEIFGEGDRVKVRDEVKPRTTSTVDL